MLLPRLAALSVAAHIAHAYTEPSPFFLVSSNPLAQNATLQSTQLAKTRDVEDRLIESLSDCTAQRYTIVSQQGVSARDFQEDGFTRTRASLAKAQDGALVDIPNVGILWDMDGERIQERLTDACLLRGKLVAENGAESTIAPGEVVIEHTTMQKLPLDKGRRSKAIAEADKDLGQRVGSVVTASSDEQSVLIYITTGPSPDDIHSRIYEMDDSYAEVAMHTDLKRDVLSARQGDYPTDAQAGLPLFEKYQFFTPGVFMGLFVSILLLSILSVAVNAISGLEVSYAAFRKENGPQAQKSVKQQ